MTAHSSKITKYLKDYTPSNYLVNNIELIFTINKDESVTVISKTTYYKNTTQNVLTLNGSAKICQIKLELTDDKIINLFDAKWQQTDYKIKHQDDELIIAGLPETFNLIIETILEPNKNKSCMGLYGSNGSFFTQCEAQGFRSITYYPDRPDVMANFTTLINFDHTKYKFALANGNKVKEIRHNSTTTVTWVDPFKKPCYLFALVIGNFAVLKDSYTTKSGQKVNLEIYSTPEQITRCNHAMESLKRAMRWDESRFNLEYDLDTYMIVAAPDFNMGAMENKGLNIFNTKYVIADKDTATDIDFIKVEAVIGHEYFHNWTGNRVTCRDWFQLSLKEGLTVFRDQEFTSDLHNRGVTRVENVKLLRQYQFTEDGGPLAHSVRPEAYIEMNNFYTMTVYEKGAEIVRMYQSILGKQGFNKGLELYLKQHDGNAATCEDFCHAMSQANGFNLDQFMLWYSQAGTPEVQVKTTYSLEQQEYILEFEQNIPDTPEQKNKQPMLIPIKLGLITRSGQEITSLNITQGKYVKHEDGLVLLLTEKYNKFIFSNMAEPILPSLLREFSAPIKLKFKYSEHDLLILAKSDNDEFNRFEAMQSLFSAKIKAIYIDLSNKSPSQSVISNEFWQSLRGFLEDPKLDPAFKAMAFKLPNFSEMLTQITDVNPNLLNQAITIVAQQIGKALFDSWMEIYNLNLTLVYQFNDHAKRSLKNTALYYIMQALANKVNNPSSLQLIETMALGQYHNSDNMTDSIAVLTAVNDLDIEIRNFILADFYNKWQHNELVMDKWFAIQASSSLINIHQLNKLMVDKAFSATNPNKIYSLLRTFTLNGWKFHTDSGYNFIADKIIIINKFNPQVASGLVQGFNNSAYLHHSWQQMAKNSLQHILNQPELSSDVYERVSKIYAGLNTL